MEREEIGHLGGFKKKFISSTRVCSCHVDADRIRIRILTGVGTDFEQFAVGLNLSTIPEAAQFVARQTELTEMYRLLHGHKTRSAVVLHGLGGIGKTQLAIEYVRRHKEKYTAIFWLNANDEDSLRLSFRGVA
jgi:hypothetical protein